MTVERTLSIIKPDAMAAGQADTIYQCFSETGLTIIASKNNYQLSREEAEGFYTDHRGKPFFEGLIQFMISGPISIHILEGAHVIDRYRQLMGATDPTKADPNTLRAKFGGKAMPANAVHGSDSHDSARREIAFFFKETTTL